MGQTVLVISDVVLAAMIVACVQLVTHFHANRRLRHIEVLTNSTYTAAKMEIESLKKTIVTLTEELTKAHARADEAVSRLVR